MAKARIPETRSPLAEAERLLRAGHIEAARAKIPAAAKSREASPNRLMALGEALWRAGGPAAAVEVFAPALAAAPGNAKARIALGHSLTDAGEVERALAVLAPFADSADPEELACLAGAQLAAGYCEDAARTAGKARRLVPRHAVAWYLEGKARAGQGRDTDALTALERAATLKPGMPPIEEALAQAATRQGRLARAESAWRAILERVPDHDTALDGLAKLLWMRGERDGMEALFERARAARPDSPVVAYRQARLVWKMGEPVRALALLEAAGPEMRESVPGRALEAELRRETGDLDGAIAAGRAMHGQAGSDPEASLAYLKALLQAGRAHEALEVCQWGLAQAPERRALWRAWDVTARKALQDPNYRDLADYDRAVGIYDLAPPAGYADAGDFNARLAERLYALHSTQAHPLDQSLRGGTQTVEPLHKLQDPIIAAVFEIIRPAVEAFIAALPEDGEHPFYRRRATGWSVSGAWSVRLRPEGYHVDHVHEAWISSVYYVTVPDVVARGDAGAGHLRFGRPPITVPGAETPDFVVRPRPGRLVLFPSYLWHGTDPFSGPQERLTIAFDLVSAQAPPGR